MMVAIRFDNIDLPGTGRADHENVVTAGDRHFDRALHVPLTFHVAEIDIVTLMRGEK